MERYIRRARVADLEKITAVLESGRRFLEEQGLPQWQDGYGPGRVDAAADIKAGYGYVLMVSNAVAGYAALIPEPDGSPPLSEGAYAGQYARYIAIHRVAVDGALRGSGLSRQFLRDMVTAAGGLGYQDVRIDTHPGNVIMQRIIDRVGFSHRGTMHLPIPHGERLAYQVLLD